MRGEQALTKARVAGRGFLACLGISWRFPSPADVTASPVDIYRRQ